MSVPLDRLYNFLHDLCNGDIIIYRYLPHGSRNLEDCVPLENFELCFDSALKVRMVCHDQESLKIQDFAARNIPKHGQIPDVPWPILKCVEPRNCHGIHDKVLLLHSEKNSVDLEWFERKGSVGVYWWCHAVIARDWFRFAAHDPNLARRSPQKCFLIYNRSWSGFREYRIKFAELLLEAGLQDQCRTWFSPVDDQSHYAQHKFVNQDLQNTRTDIEQWFEPSNCDATASADYEANDYVSTAVEIVLETIFDDTKHHLTEKILRPIACGHPFILAATPGSLEYLRSYGFKTFHDFWDESYDTIADPVKRLQAIVNLMQDLANTDPVQLIELTRDVCLYNRQRFFSQEFFDQVVDEYKNNLHLAMDLLDQNQSYFYFKRRLIEFQKYNKTLVSSEYMQQALAWFDSQLPARSVDNLTRVPSQSSPGGLAINSPMRRPSSM